MTDSIRLAVRGTAALGVASGLIVLFGLVPRYLLNYLRLTREETAAVMSGAGLGALIGFVAAPFVARAVGWRRSVMAGLVGAIVSIYAFRQEGPDLVRLFALLAAIAFFTAGTLRLIIGRALKL